MYILLIDCNIRFVILSLKFIVIYLFDKIVIHHFGEERNSYVFIMKNIYIFESDACLFVFVQLRKIMLDLC